MAYRPDSNLIEGVIDNTKPGYVTGWIDFFRMSRAPLHCRIDLDGDFHDEIRGQIVHIWNEIPTDCGIDGSLGRIEPMYMDAMNPTQDGEAGDITVLEQGGLSIEWYSRVNGRVVLSVRSDCFHVLGPDVDRRLLPPRKDFPGQFESYLRELAIAFRRDAKDPTASVLAVGQDGVRSSDDEPNN